MIIGAELHFSSVSPVDKSICRLRVPLLLNRASFKTRAMVIGNQHLFLVLAGSHVFPIDGLFSEINLYTSFNFGENLCQFM